MYSVSYSQNFQHKISKGGAHSFGAHKNSQFRYFWKVSKILMIFCPNWQFLTQRDIYSKSNLVLLPPDGVHSSIFCHLWTNHRTVQNQIFSKLSCDWFKDDKILRTLGSVDTTCWQYSATFTKKPRPFTFVPALQHTGAHLANFNEKVHKLARLGL